MHTHVCTCAHVHTSHIYTHAHTLTFNDRDWSWDDPKAQNLVSYYRPGLTAKKRTERQECWTNSVLGWMSGCAYTESLYWPISPQTWTLSYTEPLYWPISPQTWILWFHGGILLLFLQRGGECIEIPYPSFLQQAGSTGNLNLPLAMAVCEAWCFWLSCKISVQLEHILSLNLTLKVSLILLSLQLILSIKCPWYCELDYIKIKHTALYKVLLCLCSNFKCAWFCSSNLCIFILTE